MVRNLRFVEEFRSRNELPMSDVELTPVRETHRFDESALHRYMQSNIEAYRGPFSIQQFEGGQSNPTFLLETPTKRYVLRKQPPGQLLPSAHAVDREYRVMDALRDTPVPVPMMYSLCEDTSVIGTKFYVMEMVEGRLYTKTALPTLSHEDRRAVYLDMVKVLADLHKVDPSAVGLESFGRSGNYFARQVSRWSKQYVASETETIKAMNFLIEWLPDHLPDSSKPVIVHGDYRLGNVLLDEQEPKVVAVLDWELSTLGDPLADLGYWCQEYYGDNTSKEDTLATADLISSNLPTEEELVNAYCTHAGRDQIKNWVFYIAYNMFRSAGIVQGVYKRGLDGNASSEKFMEYAKAPRQRAEAAWRLIQSAGLA